MIEEIQEEILTEANKLISFYVKDRFNEIRLCLRKQHLSKESGGQE
ncbi:MAG: hypothetical protein ACTSU7_00060 [Candidatus Heimdallarchaeaceae archaeon]